MADRPHNPREVDNTKKVPERREIESGATPQTKEKVALTEDRQSSVVRRGRVEVKPGEQSTDKSKVNSDHSVHREKTPERDDPAVERLASSLHERWRAERNYMPRVKSTRDQGWIDRQSQQFSQHPDHVNKANIWLAKQGGRAELDIAALPYKDLPTDWQAENKASAEGAIGIVRALQVEGKDMAQPENRETASARLHNNWLERNAAWATEEQRKPYEQLSEMEKEKDRVVIQEALRILSE